MAGSRFHKSKQRRAERAPLTAHGGLNLVPLVDILTSIVFFSLATYTGAALAALTAFDLSLPPTVVTAPQATNNNPDRQLHMVLAVKVNTGGYRIEHAGNDVPFVKEIKGTDSTALADLRNTLAQIRQQFPDNHDILVVPDDNVDYDNVIHVLEQAKAAQFTSISLGNRARATNVATASPVSNSGGR